MGAGGLGEALRVIPLPPQTPWCNENPQNLTVREKFRGAKNLGRGPLLLRNQKKRRKRPTLEPFITKLARMIAVAAGVVTSATQMISPFLNLFPPIGPVITLDRLNPVMMFLAAFRIAATD